jgi:hypothetical protein
MNHLLGNCYISLYPQDMPVLQINENVLTKTYRIFITYVNELAQRFYENVPINFKCSISFQHCHGSSSIQDVTV